LTTRSPEELHEVQLTTEGTTKSPQQQQPPPSSNSKANSSIRFKREKRFLTSSEEDAKKYLRWGQERRKATLAPCVVASSIFIYCIAAARLAY
jgi:hypothetical protein